MLIISIEKALRILINNKYCLKSWKLNYLISFMKFWSIIYFYKVLGLNYNFYKIVHCCSLCRKQWSDILMTAIQHWTELKSSLWTLAAIQHLENGDPTIWKFSPTVSFTSQTTIRYLVNGNPTVSRKSITAGF